MLVKMQRVKILYKTHGGTDPMGTVYPERTDLIETLWVPDKRWVKAPSGFFITKDAWIGSNTLLSFDPYGPIFEDDADFLNIVPDVEPSPFDPLYDPKWVP